MSAVLILVIAIALNLVPSGVSSFTVTTSDEETVRFTQLPDEGWKATLEENGKDDLLGTFYIEGTLLTVKAGDERHTLNLVEMFGVDEATDWASLERISTGGNSIPVAVDHNDEGFDLAVREGAENEASKVSLKVRWGKTAE